MIDTTATAARAIGGSNARAEAVGGVASRIGEIQVFRDLPRVEAVWRLLETQGVLSPYQRFDWIALWQHHAGTAAGISPRIVVAFDRRSTPLFVWPLGLDTSSRLGIARFLGGKHANFNFGPWRADAAVAGDELVAVLQRLPETAPEIEVLELLNQPRNWEGMSNPLQALPHQPSPSEGFRLPLDGSSAEVLARAYSSSTRGRLRTKERKLQAIPGYRYARATDALQVQRYLDAFFVQKAERLAAQGIANVFADPGVEEFLRAACLHGLAEGKPVIELHALDSDVGMIALFGGVNDGKRFSGMINSISLGDHSRHSPGLILLNHLVASCADRGLAMFDLGVGEADYKALLCDETETLFDSFIPLTARGHPLALALGAKARLKRMIKRSPRLWQAAQKLRRLVP